MAKDIVKYLSDETLVSNFQETSSSRCFKLLVRRYRKKLYHTAFRVVGNVDEAEEIVQETFIRVFSGFDKYRTNIPFSAWVFTIINNLCKDLWRLKQRSVTYENLPYTPLSVHEQEDWGKTYRPTYRQFPDRMPGPAQQAEIAEEKALIVASLNELPDSQKRVIILRDIEGLSYQQIADITGSAIGTVRSRLFYGRAKLRAKLEQWLMEPTEVGMSDKANTVDNKNADDLQP